MININRLYLIVICNYTAVGSIIGFVQGGIAPILRQQGITLNSMIWVFALYLPYGLAFLWAPYIERLKQRFSYRHQVLSLQTTAALLLFLMAYLGHTKPNFSVLWLLSLTLNIIIASLDLALDGLCSLSCPEKKRANMAGAKLGGLSLGVLIGGGLLVAGFAQLNWSGTFSLISVILLFSTPFAYKIKEPSHNIYTHHGLGLSVIYKDAVFFSRLWRLILLTCCLMALFNLNRLLLVDMGVALQKIGLLLGTITPLGSLLVAFILPMVLRNYCLKKLFFMVICLLLLILISLILSIKLQLINLTLWLSIGIGIGCSGILLMIASIILKWAKSGQSATDYALLYGLGRLCATFLLLGLPVFIKQFGWINYYLIMGIILLTAGYLVYQKIND